MSDYVRCPFCGALGPLAATPEEAAAKWRSVAPAPRWTSEPPKVPGWYAVSAPWAVDLRMVMWTQGDVDRIGGCAGFKFFGPIPWPPKDGGSTA